MITFYSQLCIIKSTWSCIGLSQHYKCHIQTNNLILYELRGSSSHYNKKAGFSMITVASAVHV